MWEGWREREKDELFQWRIEKATEADWITENSLYNEYSRGQVVQ